MQNPRPQHSLQQPAMRGDPFRHGILSRLLLHKPPSAPGWAPSSPSPLHGADVRWSPSPRINLLRPVPSHRRRPSRRFWPPFGPPWILGRLEGRCKLSATRRRDSFHRDPLRRGPDEQKRRSSKCRNARWREPSTLGVRWCLRQHPKGPNARKQTQFSPKTTTGDQPSTHTHSTTVESLKRGNGALQVLRNGSIQTHRWRRYCVGG